MQDAKQGVSTYMVLIVLALLAIVDACNFITVGYSASGIEFGLDGNLFAWVGLGVDLSLAFGLLRTADWALELTRYRCMLGICYLAFIWTSYFIIMPASVGPLAHKTIVAGLLRDGWAGMLLLVALFAVREKKKPVLPVFESRQAAVPKK